MKIMKFATKAEAEAEIEKLRGESDRIYKDHAKYSPVTYQVRRRKNKYQIFWYQAEFGLGFFTVNHGWVKQ